MSQAEPKVTVKVNLEPKLVEPHMFKLIYVNDDKTLEYGVFFNK